MLTDVARRVADPAEKLLTQSFRFAGWVVGRAAGPVFKLAGAAGRPVVQTLGRLSPGAAEALWGLLPGRRPPVTPEPPAPKIVRPPHVATVPTAGGAPTPAAAHAEAASLLSEVTPAAASTPADELPVKNWDGLTIAAIRQRTRNLDDRDILTLLAYERAHAARPAVVLNLENRLAKLHRPNGATPQTT
ncbi:hypothetical protein [Cryptosporangium phraense]|uniref:Lipid droplet-associated protein n=1 Tax=Cryptosporangium phraense TaxID=2593070 RepID=A0A545AKF6_9ACTN|nr:hypothetical protein [Cryptosporangium phraense]TQS41804.1 hypothetical protein FL583_27605 [Cryptosporangium phraense]